MGAQSREGAEGWRPWVGTCSEAFGTDRCMFESNFPADRSRLSYGKMWNTMKWLTAGASADEKHDLFWRSASRVYRLAEPVDGSDSQHELNGSAEQETLTSLTAKGTQGRVTL